MKHSDLYRKRGGKNRICPLEYRERVGIATDFFVKECKIFQTKGRETIRALSEPVFVRMTALLR